MNEWCRGFRTTHEEEFICHCFQSHQISTGLAWGRFWMCWAALWGHTFQQNAVHPSNRVLEALRSFTASQRSTENVLEAGGGALPLWDVWFFFFFFLLHLSPIWISTSLKQTFLQCRFHSSRRALHQRPAHSHTADPPGHRSTYGIDAGYSESPWKSSHMQAHRSLTYLIMCFTY